MPSPTIDIIDIEECEGNQILVRFVLEPSEAEVPLFVHWSAFPLQKSQVVPYVWRVLSGLLSDWRRVALNKVDDPPWTDDQVRFR